MKNQLCVYIGNEIGSKLENNGVYRFNESKLDKPEIIINDVKYDASKFLRLPPIDTVYTSSNMNLYERAISKAHSGKRDFFITNDNKNKINPKYILNALYSPTLYDIVSINNADSGTIYFDVEKELNTYFNNGAELIGNYLEVPRGKFKINNLEYQQKLSLKVLFDHDTDQNNPSFEYIVDGRFINKNVHRILESDLIYRIRKPNKNANEINEAMKKLAQLQKEIDELTKDGEQ